MEKMKQMTIDDYTNNGEVAIVDAVPMDELKEKVDKLEIESVDYKTLTKEELIKVIEDKDKAYENLKHNFDMMVNQKDKQLKDTADYYAMRVHEVDSLLEYHKRKLKLINDIVNIENIPVKKGGEK